MRAWVAATAPFAVEATAARAAGEEVAVAVSTADAVAKVVAGTAKVAAGTAMVAEVAMVLPSPLVRALLARALQKQQHAQK